MPARSKIRHRMGQVFTREYKGKTIKAKRTRKGYTYKGRVYGSLTAVATKVAGYKYPGNYFFGLWTRST